jgi:hypothetical protein
MEAQNLTLSVEITLLETHPGNSQLQVITQVASQKLEPWTELAVMLAAGLDKGDMAKQ